MTGKLTESTIETFATELLERLEFRGHPLVFRGQYI